jgi:hypothetical protein
MERARVVVLSHGCRCGSAGRLSEGFFSHFSLAAEFSNDPQPDPDVAVSSIGSKVHFFIRHE